MHKVNVKCAVFIRFLRGNAARMCSPPAFATVCTMVTWWSPIKVSQRQRGGAVVTKAGRQDVQPQF